MCFIKDVKELYYWFHERFTNINHQHPTRFSQNNFSQRKIKLSLTKFATSSRGPRLWSNILTLVQKQCTHKIVLGNQLKKHSSSYAVSLIIFNPFQVNVLFLYLLKMSEIQRFFDVFRGYRKGTLN